MKNTNSYLLIISGIIALIFGGSILFISTDHISTVAKYMGVIFLLAGIIMLIIAFMRKERNQLFNLQVVAAIASLVMGIFIYFFTAKSIALFLILFGIWSVVLGLTEIVFALQLDLERQHKNLLALNGILTIVLGISLFFNPFSDASVLVKFLTAIIAVVVGIGGIYFGYMIYLLEKNKE